MGFTLSMSLYSNCPWLEAFRSMDQQGARLFSFLMLLPIIEKLGPAGRVQLSLHTQAALMGEWR